MSRAERRAGLSGLRNVMARAWEPMLERPLSEADMQFAQRWGDFAGGWLNNRYSASLYWRETAWGLVGHLAIRRHDGAPVQGWDDLQRIKDEVAGPARVALEVYPPAEDVVAQANMRHLFVLPEGMEIPLTLKGRWV